LITRKGTGPLNLNGKAHRFTSAQSFLGLQRSRDPDPMREPNSYDLSVSHGHAKSDGAKVVSR